MRRRGFTLIELLAVIVILAIIALIATPIILGIIRDAKEESEKRSVELYANAIKNAIVTHQMKNDKVLDGIYEINPEGDMCLKQDDPSKPKVCINVEIDGDKPTKGRVTIINGTIADMEVTIGDKDFIIDSAGKVEYKLAPGLYDKDGKLLATWDELVSQGMNVEEDYTISSEGKIDQETYPGGIIDTYEYGIKLVIPDTATNIGNGAFYDCSSLTSITIPSSVTSIGTTAFSNSGLTSITIPNSVTSIGDHAFLNCYSVTSIIIPNSVTSIGEGAFQSCDNLTNITIPPSVTSIGSVVFANCTSLTSITIPSSVTSIGNAAFYNCSSLTRVTIPNSVTSIGNAAFYNCSSLSKVYFEHTNVEKLRLANPAVSFATNGTFYKSNGKNITFYFKNEAASKILEANKHYDPKYGTISDDYNW